MTVVRPTGRPTSRFRDPRLPLLYSGCWRNKSWRDLYDRTYMRIMREGPYGSDERVWRSAVKKLNVRGAVKCFACRKDGRRFTVRKVEIDGKFVWAALRWCGEC